MSCENCQHVSAVCDECELIWQDVPLVNKNPETSASSSFPECPQCKQKADHWQKLDRDHARRAGLLEYVLGESI